MRAERLADFLLVLFVAAEFDPGAALGLAAGDAGADEIVDSIGMMPEQLFFDLALHLGAAEEDGKRGAKR